MRECWLPQERGTLEFSSTNLWIWFLRWQQCANLHSIISVKLGSFVNISPLMQPSFLFKLLLHQSLTTVIRYYMVYMSKWLNSSNVCRTQLLVLLLFRPSSVILHLFLRIFTGSRFISGLNRKYLSLSARLSMDMILLISKIFFNVTFRYGILGLQKNRLVMPAFNINSYGRRAFFVATPLLWNSLPQHIRHAGSLDFLKDSWKQFFLDAPF